MDEGKLLYLILSNVLIFAIGAAALGAFFAARYRFRRWWAYVLAKVGVSVTNTILLIRLFPLGTVNPGSIEYWYTIGMLVTATGMAFVAGDLARRGGLESAKKEVE